MRTTRKTAIDIEEIFPELARYIRKTIRLHPVGKESLGRDENKFGGEFIWPHDEEWPVCNDMIYKSDSGDKCIHNENYVGVFAGI